VLDPDVRLTFVRMCTGTATAAATAASFDCLIGLDQLREQVRHFGIVELCFYPRDIRDHDIAPNLLDE
jgi:hypothetical protein